YREISFGAQARVGILSFLTATLDLPLVQNSNLRNGLLATTRFGDPTLGVFMGGPLGPLQLAPFGELTFPTSGAVTLYTSDTPRGLPDRGVVGATGGVAANLGLLLAYRPEWQGLALETSARGYFRVRSNGASNGAGFDARGRLVLRQRLIVGALVAGLFAFG